MAENGWMDRWIDKFKPTELYEMEKKKITIVDAFTQHFLKLAVLALL